MSKSALFAIAITVILAAAFVIYMKNTESVVYKPGIWPEADAAVNQAKVLYQTEKARGTDLSKGPCLSNAVISGWVADIAHNPRQPIDDVPENQCQSYLQGTVKHFVELDPQGNLIRVK